MKRLVIMILLSSSLSFLCIELFGIDDTETMQTDGNSQSTFLYYIKEYMLPADNHENEEQPDEIKVAEIIEAEVPINMDTDTRAADIPVDFVETTIEEIHAKGFLTPSEEIEIAKNNGADHERWNGYFYWGSWINVSYVNIGTIMKKVSILSKTSRKWYNPGTCYVRSMIRLNNNLIRDSGWLVNWFGWAKTYSYNCIYPRSSTFNWKVYSEHTTGGYSPYEYDSHSKNW